MKAAHVGLALLITWATGCCPLPGCPPEETWQCTTVGWKNVPRQCLLIGQYGKCTMKMQTVTVAEPIKECGCRR